MMDARTAAPVGLAADGATRDRVWVVEDSRAEAELIQGALGERYDVELFGDGLSFLERWTAAGAALPDAVVLDWELPGMPGIEVCSWLRQSGVRLPILVLTSHGDTEHVVAALAQGATDYVTKPFIVAQLVARIAGAVRTSHRERRTETVAVELRARAEEAEESMRLSETLLGIIGHDLRTPLQAIGMAAALLSQQAPTEQSVRRLAARIDGSARRMSEIIAQVLDLTRARLAGGIPVEPTAGDLVAICRAAIDEIAVAFPGRSIVLKGDSEVLGRWDAGRLAQVVTNLVTNALVHGAPDTPIEVGVGDGAAGVVLSVFNRGTIPEEAIATLFDPFRRAQSSRSGGLGLGLYITQQIVEAHGGRVDLVRRDQGTMFVVRFRRAV